MKCLKELDGQGITRLDFPRCQTITGLPSLLQWEVDFYKNLQGTHTPGLPSDMDRLLTGKKTPQRAVSGATGSEEQRSPSGKQS